MTKPGQKVGLHRVTFVNKEPHTIPNAGQIWLIWCGGTVVCFQHRSQILVARNLKTIAKLYQLRCNGRQRNKQTDIGREQKGSTHDMINAFDVT
jgi:hypothetical protein